MRIEIDIRQRDLLASSRGMIYRVVSRDPARPWHKCLIKFEVSSDFTHLFSNWCKTPTLCTFQFPQVKILSNCAGRELCRYGSFTRCYIPHQHDGAAGRATLLWRDHVTLQPGCTSRINKVHLLGPCVWTSRHVTCGVEEEEVFDLQ